MADSNIDPDTDTDTKKLELAGMALRNGVLVIGPTCWAAAVRRPDGDIEVGIEDRSELGEGATKLPLLRGPVRLAQMLTVLPAVRRLLPAARFGFESKELLGGTLLGSLTVRELRRRRGDGALVELVGSLASLGLVLGLMRGGEVAKYHAAEHKAIAGYEQDISARDAPKEHPRCGTQLAVPLLLANALATQAAMLLFRGRPRAARMAGSFAGIAVATEFARSIQQHPDTPVARGVRGLGLRLQRDFSTQEPSDAQLEVASRALHEVLAREGRRAARA